jgi:predicted porin
VAMKAVATKGRGGRLGKLAAAAALGVACTTAFAGTAEDAIKRLLDLQLRKGIITQEEYDEFMSQTTDAAEAKQRPAATVGPATAPAAPSDPEPAPAAAARASGPAQEAPVAPSDALAKAPAGKREDGVAIISTDRTRVELFGTIDLAVGYTSHSLVQSGEMPTSIGPWISGGVRYPRTTPTGPGGSQVPYPASNMSSQTGMFNSALSTSSWGIRASRDVGEGGLKVFALLDSAFNPATGQLTDQSHNQAVNSRYPTTAYATSSLNGQLFAKEAIGGFSSDDWGRVSFGRNTNFILDVLNGYAPNQKSGLFSPYGNGVYGGGGALSENARVDGSIKYRHKVGNVNFGLLYGFGGTGGLKKGARGFAANIGYETDRFGVQAVYEEFSDLLKTGTDSAVDNVINLVAYDQRAALLVFKVNLTDALHTQIGGQYAVLGEPTPDPNIPFINNLYGEDVNQSAAYVGEDTGLYTGHLGVDYDLSEKTNLSAGYVYIGLPSYGFGTPVGGAYPSRYKGGSIDGWSGLATYRLYKGTTLYGGLIYTHYRGPAFDSTPTTVYVHDIFTAGTGFRFRF